MFGQGHSCEHVVRSSQNTGPETEPDETEKRIQEHRREKLAYEGIGKMQLGTAGL
jgi:hypothetical protein